MDNILERIDLNKNFLKSQDRAYQHLSNLIYNDSLKNTSKEDLEKILSKLNLKIYDIIIKSAERGQVSIFDYFINKIDKPSRKNFFDDMNICTYDKALEAAIKKGQYEFTQYLVNPDHNLLSVVDILSCWEELYESASKSSSVKIMEYLESILKKEGEYIDESIQMIHQMSLKIFIDSAINGRLIVMQHLVNNIHNDSKKIYELIHYGRDAAFKNAAKNGKLDVLKFLVGLCNDKDEIEKMIHTNSEWVFIIAAYEGEIDIMKYLVDLCKDNHDILEKMLHSQNDTPYKHAKHVNNQEIMKFLEDLTPDPETKIKMLGEDFSGPF